VVKDRAGSEGSAEHVSEGQGEVSWLFFVVMSTFGHNKLHVSGGVLATVTGGVITERANARVAVVSSVSAVTFATLGTQLIPHLVIRVVEGHVLVRVDIHVTQTTTMTAAGIRARRAATATALKTIKALAFSGCVVAGATTRALGVLVEIRTLRVQFVECVCEVSCGDWVFLGHFTYPLGLSVEFIVSDKAAWGVENNLLGVSVIEQILNRSHSPRRSHWAVAVTAVSTEKTFVATTYITGTTRAVTATPVRASGTGETNKSSKSNEQLHLQFDL
jgi:hypothetical protein